MKDEKTFISRSFDISGMAYVEQSRTILTIEGLGRNKVKLPYIHWPGQETKTWVVRTFLRIEITHIGALEHICGLKRVLRHGHCNDISHIAMLKV